MKTIAKLLVAAVLLTAVVQASRAALRHYTFVDAVQESLLFAGNRTDEEVTDRVMAIAADYEVPLEVSDVAVRRRPFVVEVAAPYVADVDLLPGFYSRTWPFDVTVSARLLTDTRPNGRRR